MKSIRIITQRYIGQSDMKRVRRFLIILILALIIVTSAIIFNKLKKEQELEKIAKISALKTQDAPTTKLLLLNFDVRHDQALEPLTLTGVNSYNSHLGTVSSLQRAGYKLSLIRDGKTLYEYYFALPETHSEFIDPQTGEYKSLGRIRPNAISIQTPYFDIGTQIYIYNPQGQVVLQDSIEYIAVNYDRESTYNTTAGEDVE